METTIRQVDILRNQIKTERKRNESPLISELKSKLNTDLHLRSLTQQVPNIEHLSRDVSHRLDSLSKIKSSFEYHEAQLQEVLGIKKKSKPLPTSLQDLQKSAKKPISNNSKSQFIKDLQNMKIKISRKKQKLLEKLTKEGGLYKSQSGLIQPLTSCIYDSILKKSKNTNFEPSRNDVDLGPPSGRKEVEIIIAWLENIEEKVKRAQLIYSACYKEVIRQVSVQCIERGLLLQKI